MIPMQNDITNYRSYLRCVQDLLDSPEVQSMKDIPHHPGTSCYEHSVFVSYVAFRLARRWGLDYTAAARAGQCVFLICTTSLRDAGPPVRAAPFSPLNHGIRVQAEADRDGVVHPLHLRFVQPPHVLSQPPFVQRPDLFQQHHRLLGQSVGVG